jgi:tetratricopeptide (TPR) repeat protein
MCHYDGVPRGEPELCSSVADAATPTGSPPDPRSARTVEQLLHQLRLTRLWAGMPTYQEIARRIDRRRAHGGVVDESAGRMARSTVADCFGRSQRRRIDYDLLFDILRAMGLAGHQLEAWREAWQTVFAPTDPADTVAVELDLPADTPYFSGRVDQVRDLLAATSGRVVIEGMAGVGKTQLIGHVGRRLADSGVFTCQFYVNLHGFDAERAPADPAEVLASFLRALRVAANRVPVNVTARMSKYRELLRSGHPLVVLDNAASEEQVLPLLPEPGCGLTLVTSRSPLPGLAATARVSLDRFTANEATQLLASILGAERIDAEPDAAARIAGLCGHLPLALTLVAHQIAAQRDWSLHDHATRLAALGMQDSVRRAFLGSYQGLPPQHRRAVTLCALHPGHQVTDRSVGALVGVPASIADRLLDDLVLHRLLQRRGDGRYEFHDLVRDCITERLHDEVPGSQQRQALERLLAYYRHAASAAMSAYAPHARGSWPAVPGYGDEPVAFADIGAATKWLDAERSNLVAVAVLATDQGLPEYAVDLSRILQLYLDTGGHLHDAEVLHSNAVRAAEGTHRVPALTALASVYWRLGRYHDVIALLRQALVAYHQDGDRVGQARCHVNLGIAYWRTGLYEQAIEHEREGLSLAQDAGEELIEAKAHNNLGNTLWRLGRYAEALTHQRRALELMRDAGDRVGESRVLNNLGTVYLRLGDHEQARLALEAALAHAREIGDWETESNGLTNLGILHRQLGQHDVAVGLHQRALAINRETGNRDGEATVLNDLGECLQHDDAAGAHECHAAALAIAVELGSLYEQARAHAGLARSTSDPDRQHKHARAALAGFASLGTPEAQAGDEVPG